VSGVAVLRFLLANDTATLGTVPATQIFGGIIPEKTPVPALGVRKVSGTERTTVSMAGTKKLRMERVQVDIQAATYPQKDAIVELVRVACRNRNGTVNGVDLDSILPLGEGPDDDDPSSLIYACSLDFMVKWRSA
jgi:hypothetical protein